MADIIVIVSGQEFSVPEGTEPEQIRQALVSNFPDVANAEIKRGTKTIGEVEHATVEFVKRAGTKGLDGAAVAALLATVPPAAVSGVPALLPHHVDALWRLTQGRMTVEQALAARTDLDAALTARQQQTVNRTEPKGRALCHTLHTVPAVAAGDLPRGW